MEADAIEKLAEYRASSKERTDAMNVRKEQSPTIKKLRKIGMQMYWFNAAIYVMFTVAILFAGNEVSSIAIYIFIPMTALLARQSFRTAERLEDTDGRGTVFDDAFISLISIVVFLLFYPFDVLPTSIERIVHLILSILWMFQVYFVFFKKPDIYFASDVNIHDREEEFLSRQRLITVIVGVILSIPLILTAYS